VSSSIKKPCSRCGRVAHMLYFLNGEGYCSWKCIEAELDERYHPKSKSQMRRLKAQAVKEASDE